MVAAETDGAPASNPASSNVIPAPHNRFNLFIIKVPLLGMKAFYNMILADLDAGHYTNFPTQITKNQFFADKSISLPSHTY
jgi:hypothetical protein